MKGLPINLKNLGYDSYQEYLGCSHWLELTEKFKEKLGNKCEVEGCKKTENLQVHHLHYQTLGGENFRDLVLLCGEHHKKAHETDNEFLKEKIKRYVEWGE